MDIYGQLASFSSPNVIWGLLVPLAVPLIGALYTGSKKLVRWMISYRNLRILRKKLYPYFTPYEVYNAMRYYVPTRYQNIPPSKDEEPGRYHIISAKDRLIPELIGIFAKEYVETKFFLILGDSGMGKTTFMINLYLQYSRKLMVRGKFDIFLFPLGSKDVLDRISEISPEKKKNSILLLDAFDEDILAYKNFKTRMDEICSRVWEFRFIVITSRTHFFPTCSEEPYETGVFRYGISGQYCFQKLYISPFNDCDVEQYLKKRYGILQLSKRKRARLIVEKSPLLMVRPMLLSHIQDLLSASIEYDNSYTIYKILIEKWIDREASKVGMSDKEYSPKEYANRLRAFSRDLAWDIYMNREKRGSLSLDRNQVIQSASSMQLSEYDDVSLRNSVFRTRSLLNRDMQGQYKFAHKSILEWLIADAAYNNREAAYSLTTYEGIENTKRFLTELAVETLSVSKVRVFGLDSDPVSYLTEVETSSLPFESGLRIEIDENYPIHLLKDVSLPRLTCVWRSGFLQLQHYAVIYTIRSGISKHVKTIFGSQICSKLEETFDKLCRDSSEENRLDREKIKKAYNYLHANKTVDTSELERIIGKSDLLSILVESGIDFRRHYPSISTLIRLVVSYRNYLQQLKEAGLRRVIRWQGRLQRYSLVRLRSNTAYIAEADVLEKELRPYLSPSYPTSNEQNITFDIPNLGMAQIDALTVYCKGYQKRFSEYKDDLGGFNEFLHNCTLFARNAKCSRVDF